MGRGLRAAAGERVARGPAGLKARIPRLTATLKNVTLELGGNDAALILDDVAVDEETVLIGFALCLRPGSLGITLGK
jgi:acyl-CoA reductase-like NAD-dependent aldehyde dehydrogenase